MKPDILLPRIIPRKQLEVDRWNLLAARGVCPYGFSEYLDACAEHWDAWVWGDYEAGIPIPWYRKWKLIQQAYNPPFVPHLELLGNSTLHPPDLLALKERLSAHYRRINLNLRGFSQKGMATLVKPNLYLRLGQAPENIARKFDVHHKRNIQKAEKQGLRLEKTPDPDQYLGFYRKWMLSKTGDQTFGALQRLLKGYARPENSLLLAAVDSEGEWLAAVFLLNHQRRLINLAPVTSEKGRSLGATHFLLAKAIEIHSESHQIFDFEGSSIPGVYKFYKGFGAETEEILSLVCNRTLLKSF